MRPRGTIDQAGITFGVETGDPSMRTLARDSHRFGDMGHRHALLTDSADQQTPTMQRQTSVTVRHEDLRAVVTAIPTAAEVFASCQPDTNLMAGYS